MRLGVAATRLDVAAREVTLADGARVAYDTVVIATGSRARPSPWPPRPGVHVLRTLGDALAIRECLEAGGPVAVVGGGFIGAEVASSARSLGLAATIIDPLEAPMGRLVGLEPSRIFTDLAARQGVELRLGCGVEEIAGEAGDLIVRLTDGSTVEASTAVVGIGAVPNDAWLFPSGLLIDNGVVCDEYCRAVDAPHVFAAGDVARWQHPGRGALMRIEHWTNAVEQAACVAHTISHPDDPRPYAPVPYVWSDQHGWKFQIAGYPTDGARHELVGDLEAERPRAAVAYIDQSDRLVGAMTVNWPRALLAFRRGIAAGRDAESVLRELGDQAAGAARS